MNQKRERPSQTLRDEERRYALLRVSSTFYLEEREVALEAAVREHDVVDAAGQDVAHHRRAGRADDREHRACVERTARGAPQHQSCWALAPVAAQRYWALVPFATQCNGRMRRPRARESIRAERLERERDAHRAEQEEDRDHVELEVAAAIGPPLLRL